MKTENLHMNASDAQARLYSADKKARIALQAKGIVDPRLIGNLSTAEHYDAIRHYDSLLAGEIVKILQGNIPLPASKETKKHWAERY